MGFFAAVSRFILALLGFLAFLMGCLWIGQGTGYIMWPASSFMLARPIWAWYGAGLAVGGLIVMLLALRIGRRRRRF